jgi:predicted aspartyl protease
MGFVYRYASETPPAPYVLVNLANPDGSATVTDLPGRVDTGADRTVIPTAVATALALAEVDRLEFAGLGGVPVTLPVYQVSLLIRDLPAVSVEVAASDGEPHILLGRDVLNKYRIVLDGPNLRLEID